MPWGHFSRNKYPGMFHGCCHCLYVHVYDLCLCRRVFIRVVLFPHTANLVIDSIRPEDSGTYQCLAENSASVENPPPKVELFVIDVQGKSHACLNHPRKVSNAQFFLYFCTTWCQEPSASFPVALRILVERRITTERSLFPRISAVCVVIMFSFGRLFSPPAYRLLAIRDGDARGLLADPRVSR